MLLQGLLILSLFGIALCFPGSSNDELHDTSSKNDLKVGRVLSANDYKKLGVDVGQISPFVIEDGFLTTPQLIKKYGYPVEIHHIVTADGYILEMHRIPRPGAQPVYLQHGIMDSSAGWVVAGPKVALSYMLYDQGYDVWLGNIRGNRYSKNHTDPQIKESKYWDFSFHEIGGYDIPGMVDHVLETTGFKKLHYVSHSQGTTNFWAMCILRPGYCDKILSMNALAPVAYMKNIQSPFLRLISTFVDAIEMLLKLIGMNEFMPSNDILKMGGQLFCKEEAITQALCYNLIFLVTGYNSEQLNKTTLPAILGHVPAGSSTKQIVHYGQLISSQKFRQYDHGWWKNLFTYYGQVSPPDYDLKHVTAPVALHYSLNDWLAQPKDVLRLDEELPNVVGRYLVPLPAFNHLDFLFAIDARSLLYNSVLRVMRDHDQKEKVTVS